MKQKCVPANREAKQPSFLAAAPQAWHCCSLALGAKRRASHSQKHSRTGGTGMKLTTKQASPQAFRALRPQRRGPRSCSAPLALLLARAGFRLSTASDAYSCRVLCLLYRPCSSSSSSAEGLRSLRCELWRAKSWPARKGSARSPRKV